MLMLVERNDASFIRVLPIGCNKRCVLGKRNTLNREVLKFGLRSTWNRINKDLFNNKKNSMSMDKQYSYYRAKQGAQDEGVEKITYI